MVTSGVWINKQTVFCELSVNKWGSELTALHAIGIIKTCKVYTMFRGKADFKKKGKPWYKKDLAKEILQGLFFVLRLCRNGMKQCFFDNVYKMRVLYRNF